MASRENLISVSDGSAGLDVLTADHFRPAGSASVESHRLPSAR
jgi:hypothetical protein